MTRARWRQPRSGCSRSAPPPASTACRSSELPAFLAELRSRLAALESGAADIAALTRETAARRAAYVEAAAALSALREQAGAALMQALSQELPPLKLERARFFVERTMLPEPNWGPRGADGVKFLIATNPGEAPGALDRIASGGELSRLMLGLKVVLSGGAAVETLIFDEVDSGIGGATAAAVGERLARVAEAVQVLVVTHSPQVAARGQAQLRVAKRVTGERAVTAVEALNASRAPRGNRPHAGRRNHHRRRPRRRLQPARGVELRKKDYFL